jgi:hypothetical protein
LLRSFQSLRGFQVSGIGLQVLCSDPATTTNPRRLMFGIRFGGGSKPLYARFFLMPET